MLQRGPNVSDQILKRCSTWWEWVCQDMGCLVGGKPVYQDVYTTVANVSMDSYCKTCTGILNLYWWGVMKLLEGLEKRWPFLLEAELETLDVRIIWGSVTDFQSKSQAMRKLILGHRMQTMHYCQQAVMIIAALPRVHANLIPIWYLWRTSIRVKDSGV